MAYIGSSPTSQGFVPAIDYFNGDGATVSFQLSRIVSSVYQVEVIVENVKQNPSTAYNVLGSVITFTGAPLVGTNNIYVQYVTLNTSLIQPGVGTVGTAQLGSINTISSATSLALKTNAGTTAVTIDTAGNVGIGTSSPYIGFYKLTVAGDAGAGAGILIKSDSSTSAISRIGFTRDGTDGTTGLIRVANNDYSMQFWTANGTANAERMRIDSSGNVGIGRTPTNFKFEVAGRQWIQDATAPIIYLGNTLADYSAVYYDPSTKIGYVGTDGPATQLVLKTSSLEHLRIDSSGNVGIGTSSPDTGVHLRVFGNAYYTAQYGTSNKGRYGADAAGAFIEGVGAVPIMFYTNSTARASIDSSGNLLVGTTSVSSSCKQTLQFVTGSNGLCIITPDNINAVDFSIFKANGATCGSISRVGTTSAVVYTATSDYRLKENVKPFINALDSVTKLKPVTYVWKDCGIAANGFIAHELQEICPDAVVGIKDELDLDGNPKYQSIDQSKVVALLTAAIQEQQTLIEALTARLTALEAK